MTRLHDQLVVAAEADKLLDVACRTMDSPVGTLLLAANIGGPEAKAVCSRLSPAGQSIEIHCPAKRLAPARYRR